MEVLLHDLCYAARMLGANARFTAAAVLTLALGIGATAAIFSVVNQVLLRPLPSTAPSRSIESAPSMRRVCAWGLSWRPTSIL